MPEIRRYLTRCVAIAFLAWSAQGPAAFAEPVASQASTPLSDVTVEITSLLDDPNSLLGILTTQMPDLRSAIEARLRNAGERDGIIAMRDEAFKVGWEYGQRYMARFTDRADGDALLSFLTALKAVIAKMHEADAVQCFDWMFGAKPFNLENAGITVADVKAVNDAMVAVIRTGANSKGALPAKATDALVSQIATRAYASAKGYESGWALLSNPHRISTDPEKAAACMDVTTLYGEILALPKSDAIAVARVLFSNEKSGQ